MSATIAKSSTADRELVITRIFNAPRKLVFEVFTDPKHVIHWWGPNGFTNTIHHMNVKPGGEWKLTMHGPDGTNYPNLITYKEVVNQERLVWWHGSGEEVDDSQFESTIIFEDEGKKTKLTMRMVFQTKEAKDFVVEKYGALEGQKQTMARLEDYLSKL
ncbi:MAG TPA: SRPBCC family protein [Cyclobacteriaceae bacterium]